MSGFLYFIEGKKAATAAVLAAAGLGGVLTAGQVTTCESMKGPGKAAGIVAAIAGTEAALVKYVPDRQTWSAIESGVGAWLGYYSDSPPGPTDLLRTDAIGDGYYRQFDSIGGPDTWIIPRARIWNEDVAESDLPQALNLVAGRLVRKPLPRYRQACLDADRIWAAVMAANGDDGGESAAMTPVEEFEIAARILGVNYRVGLAEVNALDVLTTSSMSEIIKCFVDFPSWAVVQVARQEAKKNGEDAGIPDGGDLNSGLPADPADTPQHPPT